jgi:hypothetical protein
MVSGLIDISPAVSPEEQAFDDEIAQNEEARAGCVSTLQNKKKTN